MGMKLKENEKTKKTVLENKIVLVKKTFNHVKIGVFYVQNHEKSLSQHLEGMLLGKLVFLVNSVACSESS